MKFLIEHGPSFAWLKAELAPGESIEAEAGAMVARSAAVNMATRLNAGRGAGFFRKLWMILIAFLRKLLGGETMFINEFSSQNGGEVIIAPTLSGQIMHQKLDGQKKLIVQTGSYLASTGTIDSKLRWGGLKALLSGEGVFLLECSGTGDLFLNSYGGIIEIPVNGSYVVDTGHMVAFEESLNYKIRGVGGLKASLLSGEGLVCEFTGTGRVFIQSRNINSLVGWLAPMFRS
jgi:uncharacterized protein (TIGR00266 family)